MLVKIIEGVLDIIIAVAMLVLTVVVICWLIKLNDMSQIEKLAYEADVFINGQGVALFRTFENSTKECIDVFMNLF